ncbi:MAG: S23 ribosomal [Planctomycetota bacterium]|nr:MAG: S23 ribosomal [Planctomycetota bacterium]
MGAELSGYRKLIAWERGLDLVDAVYDAVRFLPPDERFGLSTQMRRAAVSVPSNIAEGYCRQPRANVNHLGISLGSAAELDTQVCVCLRRKFLSAEQTTPILRLILEQRKITYGLISSIERRFGLESTDSPPSTRRHPA